MKRKYFQDTVAKQFKKHKPFEKFGEYGGSLLGYAYGGAPGSMAGGMIGAGVGNNLDWGAQKLIKTRKTPGIVGSSVDPKNNNTMGRTKAISRESGATTRNPGSKHVKRGKKSINVRTPKVSKAFRLKVDKVLEKAGPTGSAEEIGYGSLNIPLPGQQDTQRVGGVNSPDYSAWSFDNENWCHLIGVLWGGAAYSRINQQWETSMLGTGSMRGTATSAANSDNLKFHVMNSWEKHLIKNDTARTISISIYTCAPKKSDFKVAATSALGAAGATIATPAGLLNPYTMWSNCYGDDTVNGINIGNVNSSYLFECPSRLPAWKKAFSYDLVKIVLEPGQTYEHFVQGPKHFDINMTNCFQAGAYLGIQKHMRFVMYVTHLDLTGAVVSGNGEYVGRPGVSFSASSGYGLKVEKRKFVAFKMPEVSGFFNNPIGASTGAIQLGYRRPAYFKVINVAQVEGQGATIRIDEENPVLAVTQGL